MLSLHLVELLLVWNGSGVIFCPFNMFSSVALHAALPGQATKYCFNTKLYFHSKTHTLTYADISLFVTVIQKC